MQQDKTNDKSSALNKQKQRKTKSLFINNKLDTKSIIKYAQQYFGRHPVMLKNTGTDFDEPYSN